MATILSPYQKSFYDETEITSSRSAQVIVPLILELTGAKSVVDLGCGTGAWLAAFKSFGAEQIAGVDNAALDNANLQIPRDCTYRADLSKPFNLDRKFDLATCLEVAEHLPESSAAGLVGSLTRLAPMVLFSGAIPHQGGTNHINEQWPEYWAAHFAVRGYQAVDCIREAIWKNDDVAYWYAQNLILYVRNDVLANNPKLIEYAKRTDPHRLTFIHPKTYIKNHKSLQKPEVILMRFAWGLLPRWLKVRLAKDLSTEIWKFVSTKY